MAKLFEDDDSIYSSTRRLAGLWFDEVLRKGVTGEGIVIFPYCVNRIGQQALSIDSGSSNSWRLLAIALCFYLG